MHDSCNCDICIVASRYEALGVPAKVIRDAGMRVVQDVLDSTIIDEFTTSRIAKRLETELDNWRERNGG